MKTLCIYHGNCADGFGAAWVVRKALGDEVEFYPGVYQQEPPEVAGRNVILVDFSYKRAVIEKMLETANSITIIDHHKTAIEDLAALNYNVTHSFGIYRPFFDISHSGAMLAWLHFFPNQEPPALIRHIEDRDLWKFQIDGTREVQAAVFSFPYDFEVWDRLMAMDAQELRKDGAAIERKHFKDIREFIGTAAGRMVIAGHNVPALNAPYFWSSDAGHILAEGEPFAACYWDTPDGQVFSLRSSNSGGMDVSEIAKQFGGGGHKNAAGFKLPLESALKMEKAA